MLLLIPSSMVVITLQPPATRQLVGGVIGRELREGGVQRPQIEFTAGRQVEKGPKRYVDDTAVASHQHRLTEMLLDQSVHRGADPVMEFGTCLPARDVAVMQ